MSEPNYLEEAKQLVESFNVNKESVTEMVKIVCQNKDYPLEDRWNLFLEAGLGNQKRFIIRPEGIDWTKVEHVDDFYLEKYQTCTTKDFIDTLEDHIDEENEKFKDVDVNVVKEWFLKEFIISFVFDW